MRDLYDDMDHHERRMMMDLVGEARRVPPVGSRAKASKSTADSFSVGRATSVWSRVDFGTQRPILRTSESAAVATLQRLGYEWHGGELWAPQVGNRPQRIDREIEHHAIWDAALAEVMAAPTIPTPWASSIGVETDSEYRLRIIEEGGSVALFKSMVDFNAFLLTHGADLDVFGRRAGVIRKGLP